MENSNIHLSVDAAIFGFEDGGLFIVLIKRKNPPFQDTWCLPGGFVDEYEPLETAAKRELEEETGLRVSHLHQVYAFGDPHRDPRHRTVSIAHVGLVKKSLHQPIGGDDAKEAKWFSIDHLPELGFDHEHVIKKSLLKLKTILFETSVDTETELSDAEIITLNEVLENI